LADLRFKVVLIWANDDEVSVLVNPGELRKGSRKVQNAFVAFQPTQVQKDDG
jgi:hypothetical protein